MIDLIQIHTKYSVAGILVHDGVVIDTAPIYGWMRGKQWRDVKKWKKITKIVRASTSASSDTEYAQDVVEP